MEGYLAEIRMFAGNFAPRTWAYCQGQLLSITQNTALFSLLGTVYGGDGRVSFALPNLAGRVPVGTGNGPGLPPVELGQVGGSDTNILTINQLPQHTHAATATVTPAASTGGRGVTTTNVPTNNYPVQTSEGNNIYTTAHNVVMGQSPVNVTVQTAGSSEPVNNMQPFLGMNYIICTEGLFPSRN